MRETVGNGVDLCVEIHRRMDPHHAFGLARELAKFRPYFLEDPLLPDSVQKRMAWALEETSRNTGMVLTLALNYSSRSEIVDAFRSIVHAARNNGGLDHLKNDEETVNRHLYTCHLPELDLVIRTSGELRLSNFLLWQAAYAELYVTKTFWPDYRGTHLLEAIADYQQRERRYGGLVHSNGNHSR